MADTKESSAVIVQQSSLKFGVDCLFGEEPAPPMDASAQLLVSMMGLLRQQQSNLLDVAEHLAPAQKEAVIEGKTLEDMLAECNRNLLETTREAAVACTVLQLLPSQLAKLFGILQMDAAGGNKPMEAGEIDAQLGSSRVAQAAQVLATKAQAAIVTADKVTDSIIRKLGDSAQLQGHYDKLEKFRGEIATQEKAQRTAEDAFLNSRAQLAQLKQENDELSALGQGREAYRAHLQGSLNQAKDELKRLKTLQENYTFRMWGIFSSMWENDVALAKANRERQERVVAGLEAKLQAPSDLSTLQTKKIANAAAIDRARGDTENREKDLKEAQKNLASVKGKFKGTEVAIHNLLKEMKVQSGPQLMRAYAAAKSFDQVARSIVAQVANTEGLNMYLSTLGSYLKRIKSQPDARAQMLAVRFIFQEMAQNGTPIAVFSVANAGFTDCMVRRITDGERERVMARVQHIVQAKTSPVSLPMPRDLPQVTLAETAAAVDPQVTLAQAPATVDPQVTLAQTPATYVDPFM